MFWKKDKSTGFWVWEISWLEFTVYPNPYPTPKNGKKWEWSSSLGTVGRAKTEKTAKRKVLLHAEKMLHELGAGIGYDHEL